MGSLIDGRGQPGFRASQSAAREMSQTSADPVKASQVEVAIARVLETELMARESVTRAGETAAAIGESARGTARALALRTESRIRAVRAAFDRRTTAQVAALDAQANAADVEHDLTLEEIAGIDAAVAALAARLLE